MPSAVGGAPAAVCGLRHIGCCDDSLARHAAAHWRQSGHPIIRSVKLAAIRDALDRAGLAARTAVEVEVGPPKPYEAILERIEAGSRAEYRRSIGRPDDSGIED
jgi:hypothetical protein